MFQDTRIALFLLAEQVAALQANDPDLFKRWLYGGIQDLGEAAVTELLLDWIDPFITRVERDRIVAWTPDQDGTPPERFTMVPVQKNKSTLDTALTFLQVLPNIQ